MPTGWWDSRAFSQCREAMELLSDINEVAGLKLEQGNLSLIEKIRTFLNKYKIPKPEKKVTLVRMGDLDLSPIIETAIHGTTGLGGFNIVRAIGLPPACTCEWCKGVLERIQVTTPTDKFAGFLAAL